MHNLTRQAALAILVVAAAAPTARGQQKLRDVLPALTGSHAVGRSTFFWADPAREDSVSGRESHPRELRVDLWYPATVNASSSKAAYCPDLQAIKSKVGLEAVAQASVATHTFADPPLAAAPARFPVVVFSPGNGTNATQYAALVEELVSHAYLVATVDHPYQSAAIAYPDGRVIGIKDSGEPKQPPADPEEAYRLYRAKVDVRVTDLCFVLDQLARLTAGQLDARFKDRLDMDRVGVVGHSLGGIAAPSACMRDARFKVAVNMDGHARSMPLLPDAEGNGPRQPFLEVTDSHTPPRPSDEQLTKWKVTRDEFERGAAEQAQRFERLMRTIAGGSQRVTVSGATHQSFSDNVLWIGSDPKPHQHRTQIIRDYVRAFLDKHLLGARDTLVDRDDSPYAEVTIEHFRPAAAAK